MGSKPDSFAFRFGFDAIFAAIGLSGADSVGVAAWVCFDVDFVVGVVDVADVVVGLADDDIFVGFTAVVGFAVGAFVGFPVDVGLPVDIGLPVVVGLPTDVGLADVVGLPVAIGLPMAGGLPAPTGFPGFCARAAGSPLATTGASTKDVAATIATIVAEIRMRFPPDREPQT
jgi:hypothetical protein